MAICIDIETINAQGLSKEQQMVADRMCSGKRAIKSPSLSAWSGQIICIGVGIDDKIATLANMPEKEMLEAFWTLIMDKITHHVIVTFNGKDFDIPFIQKRSGMLKVHYGQKMPSITCNKYYNDRHFDVMQVLTNYGKEQWLSLQDYCIMFGIPIEDSMNGCDVGPLWAAGRIREIEQHCASDVRATLELYHRIVNYI